VLIQWGGNWCSWCLRLNELMTTDKAVARALAANYELVHIDTGRPEGKNMELAQSYGADLSKYGFPYLTVLDSDAKVLANQETGPLEAGSINAGHDPAKVLAFLGKNAVSAEESAIITRDVTTAAEQQPKSKQVIGQPFELRFTDAISGKNIDVQKDLKGKIVVIDFWATWCGPCVAEMPKNKELYAKYKDKGVEFIGVSLDKSEAEGGLKRLKDFVAENHIDWPQYYQGNFVSSEFSHGWGITTIPTVFVIDADGKLASVQASGNLEAVIQELVAKHEGKTTSANKAE
jgi:thiol-disulfide isomerase/thioredoxin